MTKYILRTKLHKIAIPMEIEYTTKKEAEKAKKIGDKSPMTVWAEIDDKKIYS